MTKQKTTENANRTATGTIGRINRRIERLGLSDQEASAHLGVPLPTYRKWKYGTREPSSVVVRLLDVLDMIEVMAPVLHDQLK